MIRKFRLGGVGLGHRGRSMLKWANDGIDSFEAVAACDLDPDRFYKPCHLAGKNQSPLKDELPNV
ncbi:MAG: hypothetical protein IKO93_07885, partial [Lentisphaeria bacterium]|nr:hypothetical protein [Lentisphaeria bacterium]